MNELLSISPIDGRYFEKSKDLIDYFSEYALIKYRVTIEIRWLLFLLEKNIVNDKINKEEKEKIQSILNKFSLEDAMIVKQIEKVTKHDVKACEYFLQVKFKELKIERLIPFIHITLTSEDINNTSYNLMVNDGLKIYL